MVGMLGEMADQPSGGRVMINGTVYSAGLGGGGFPSSALRAVGMNHLQFQIVSGSFQPL